MRIGGIHRWNGILASESRAGPAHAIKAGMSSPWMSVRR